MVDSLDPEDHFPCCKFARSAACSTPVECEHGHDVCPICDPCTCAAIAKAQQARDEIEAMYQKQGLEAFKAFNDERKAHAETESALAKAQQERDDATARYDTTFDEAATLVSKLNVVQARAESLSTELANAREALAEMREALKRAEDGDMAQCLANYRAIRRAALAPAQTEGE